MFFACGGVAVFNFLLSVSFLLCGSFFLRFTMLAEVLDRDLSFGVFFFRDLCRMERLFHCRSSELSSVACFQTSKRGEVPVEEVVCWKCVIIRDGKVSFVLFCFSRGVCELYFFGFGITASELRQSPARRRFEGCHLRIW